MRQFIIIFVFLIGVSGCYSQGRILYKQVDTTDLFMRIYTPKNMDKTKKYPAMVFFYGGGWSSDNTNQFKSQAEYFSQRGLVCFLVDYRVAKIHQSTPFESLKDAKSAIRFIRKEADRFNMDPSKVIASGGSAGGHLAAATAFNTTYNEDTDNIKISCIPNALVLFNPVIDNGPGGFGYQRIGKEYKDFSPIHNIQKGAPPTIIFLGDKDPLIPVETVKYYKTVMEKVKSRCDIFIYKGQKHGFFNHNNFKHYKLTVFETDKFLKSLGYLSDQPIINIE